MECRDISLVMPLTFMETSIAAGYSRQLRTTHLIRGSKMAERSKLLSISVKNIGCIGEEPVVVSLDEIVCLVGRNNAGKSTILTAYQLAKNKLQFTSSERHQHAAADSPSEIEMEVHIPKGLGNIDEKWKIPRDGKLVVKSRWTWLPPEFKAIRQTWDPSLENGKGAWNPDEKAGGFDAVFGSRLPEPIRIGSLDDAIKSEAQLLKMALTPLASDIAREQGNETSALSKALNDIQARVDELATSHKAHFDAIATRVSSGVTGVFPSLTVSLSLSPGAPAIEFEKLIREGSKLHITDGQTTTSPSQQGTGARRTLFWGMVRVLSELEREKAAKELVLKQLEKAKKDAETKLKKPPKGSDPDALKAAFDLANNELQKILAGDIANEGAADLDDVAFPGYILLIDEPENALHPMAARAAQRFLYELAKGDEWQVILTTHSPYFVNPFEDHTTIVRLDRSQDAGACTVTKMYRSDLVEFAGNEKEQLQALQQIDPSFSEVFFGSYPVIVEGDTEHAAFIAAAVEATQPLADRITPIRARGKALIVPLIKVLRHFKIPFGVLHDTDSPYAINGNKNGMWTENLKIWEEIDLARKSGLSVRHRVSTPDFERRIGLDSAENGKPLTAYLAIKADLNLQESIRNLMTELYESVEVCPVGGAIEGADYLDSLLNLTLKWATDNGVHEQIIFAGKA